jgi:hypothetical protein
LSRRQKSRVCKKKNPGGAHKKCKKIDGSRPEQAKKARIKQTSRACRATRHTVLLGKMSYCVSKEDGKIENEMEIKWSQRCGVCKVASLECVVINFSRPVNRRVWRGRAATKAAAPHGGVKGTRRSGHARGCNVLVRKLPCCLYVRPGT